MEIIIAVVVVLVLMAGLVLYDAFSWGFVCFKFWAWFILPIFPMLPHINIWAAIGLMFFITLFKNHQVQEEEDSRKQIIKFIIAPWLLLFTGYLIKTFLIL